MEINNGMSSFPARPALTGQLLVSAIVNYLRVTPDWLDFSLEDVNADSMLNGMASQIASRYHSSIEPTELGYLLKSDGWEISDKDFDRFEEMDHFLRREENKLIQRWLDDNTIDQPIAKKTRVTCLIREKTGVIDCLCHYIPGSYFVKPDIIEGDNKTIRWICLFENVSVVD